MHGAILSAVHKARLGAGMGRVGRGTRAAFSVIALLLGSSPAFADAAPNHVRGVAVHAADSAASVAGSAEIEIQGTATPTYNVRVESGGKRLVVELSNADIAGAPEAITEATGVVGGVLTQTFKTPNGTGNVTRLIVNLAKPATYRVRTDGTTLRISLTPDASTSAGVEAAAVPETHASPSSTAGNGPPMVTGVKFERTAASGKGERCANGCDRIVIAASAAAPYAVTVTPKGNLRLAVKGARLQEGVSRTLDVTAYKGGLSNVTTSYSAAADATLIEVARDVDVQGHVSLEGSNLVWSFELPTGSSVRTVNGKARGDGGATRHTVTVAREDALPDVPRVQTAYNGNGESDVHIESTAGGEAGFTSTTPAQVIGTGGKYSGRRIDLDLKDADIHNILRLLADVGKVNIVTADDVSGSITIRMRNVPWDQALDVVLQAKGLGMVRSGNLIRVAPAATLNKERELRLAQAKQEYELTPLETRLIPVSYAQAEEIQSRAKDMLSPRGSMAVDDRTNVIIARDIGPNLNHIEELVRSLDTQTPQVLVEARIVEATSRYLRDVGIQWGGDATFSAATGNPTGLAFPSNVSLSGGASDGNTPTAGLSPFQRTVTNPNFAINLPAAVGTGSGGAIGMSFGSIDNAFNLGVRLSAAETSGLVRIVSSPRILTLDNKEARINQGTLIPFSQVSAQGVQTTFQEAKLQLLVKPHVTADGSVSMHVKINRDEPDFNQTSARGDPTILKREAETDLLVMDGHTAVIGGIYTRNTGRNIDQVPFFGDIPILGILFQRRRASDARNELVIFLTPRIVNRAEALGR